APPGTVQARDEGCDQPCERERAVQPEQCYLAAMGMPGELQLHPKLLRPPPGIRLMGEQYGRGAFRPAAQRGAKIEAPAPGIVHTAQPEPVSHALDQDPAVAQDPHAGPLQLALDGVGPRPEIVVAEAGEDAVLCGDGCD